MWSYIDRDENRLGTGMPTVELVPVPECEYKYPHSQLYPYASKTKGKDLYPSPFLYACTRTYIPVYQVSCHRNLKF